MYYVYVFQIIDNFDICLLNSRNTGQHLKLLFSFLQVKLNVYTAYIRAVGIVLTIFIIFFFILYNASSIYSNVWLSEWSNDARNPNISRDVDQRNMRLGVYGALGILQGQWFCN